MIIPPAGPDIMRERRESCSSNDSESENYYLERSRSRRRPISRPRSKHNAISNYNEDTYKIINHLHRTMTQQKDVMVAREKNNQNSRYDSR